MRTKVFLFISYDIAQQDAPIKNKMVKTCLRNVSYTTESIEEQSLRPGKECVRGVGVNYCSPWPEDSIFKSAKWRISGIFIQKLLFTGNSHGLNILWHVLRKPK
jgi:hypothetical protein